MIKAKTIIYGCFFILNSFVNCAKADSGYYAKSFYNSTHTAKSDLENANHGNLERGLNIKNLDSPKYRSSSALGIAIGKAFNDFSVELEGRFFAKMKSENSENIIFKDVEGDIDKVIKHLAEESDSEKDIPARDNNQRMYIFAKNRDIKHSTLMANIYYKPKLGKSLIDIEIGAGIGIAKTQLECCAAKYPIALQGSTNILFNASKNFIPYVGYKMTYVAKKDYVINNTHTLIKDISEYYQNGHNQLWGSVLTKKNVNLSKEEDPKFKFSYLLHNIEIGINMPFQL
jgi:hypothetical protein